MASRAADGAKALAASDYQKAITLYTEALSELPRAADYYIQRSTAYQRSQKADLALKDADVALSLATARQKREFIISAQFRRAVALVGLKRWQDAEFVLEIVKRLDPKFKGLEMWILTVQNSLKSVEAAEVLVTEKPHIPLEEIEKGDFVGIPLRSQTVTKASATAATGSKPAEEVAKAPPVPAAPPKLGVSSATDKIREDWYQTATSINLSLLVKNVPKEETTVDIKDNLITVTFPLESKEPYVYSLTPYDEIDPDKSTFRITPTKIELTIAKAGAKLAKWPNIRAPADAANPVATATAPKAPAVDKPPAYPTSAKSGPKDWEKIKLSKEEEELDGDPVTNFFSSVYGKADDDTKRAMMKSYTESNGTVLNTNWESVKKSKVETTPPEGMVEKQWGKE